MASQFPPKKNTAFTLFFTLYKNDGTIIANPGTVTKKVSIDGAVVADIAAAVTKEDTTYGQCSLVIAAAEMNGDAIWIYIKDDTAGCVPFTCTLYTVANTQDEIGTEITSVKAKTDQIVFTIANQIDANALSGSGSGGSLDAAGVRDAVGLALANLDTQLTALPTDADVNTACDTAISDAGIPAAVWESATRTLSSISDSSGVTTLLSRVTDAVALAATALSNAIWTNTKADYIDAAISSIEGGVGTGPNAKSYTITINNIPCADALVIMSTDSLGENSI